MICPEDADGGGEDGAADGTDGAADADDGADRSRREDIGGRGEQIRRPALVRRGGNGEQRDGLPEPLRERNEDARQGGDRADQHGGTTAPSRRVAAANEIARQPAAEDAADGGAHVDKN